MEIDPLELIEADESSQDESGQKERARLTKDRSRLNTAVAITIALLATFIGICKVKDDNIVQAMQQAQADKIDTWNFYQARNIREEIANATVTQLKPEETAQPLDKRSAFETQISTYEKLAQDQHQKKAGLQTQAEQDQKLYDQLNFHDDQFDLSDASLAIAISMLAVTSLTQKKWLYGVALIPAGFGVLLGVAGLAGWTNIHPNALTNLLSENHDVSSQPIATIQTNLLPPS